LDKLRVLSGREVCRMGSHVAMQRAEAAGAVPVPDHKELRTGTLMSIIRQSGLPRSEFE